MNDIILTLIPFAIIAGLVWSTLRKSKGRTGGGDDNPLKPPYDEQEPK